MAQSLDSAFADYLARTAARNLSSRTLDKYRREGARMVTFFKAQGRRTAAQVDRSAADAWNLSLAQTLHPNTRRCLLAIAQGFFHDLKERGDIAVNPFQRFPRPKVVVTARPFCTPAQAQTIFSTVPTATFYGARIRLLMLCCYHGALRLDEALSLDWCDVDLVTDELTVRGKGGNIEKVAVNPDLRAELEAFRARWTAHSNGAVNGPVFVGRRGRRWRAKDVYASLAKFGFRGYGSRIWRRSALTNLANGGVHVHVVQKFARHKSLASTAVYLQAVSPQVRQAAAALSSGLSTSPNAVHRAHASSTVALTPGAAGAATPRASRSHSVGAQHGSPRRARRSRAWRPAHA